MGLSDGNLLGTILVIVDGIIFGIGVGTDMVALDASFIASNHAKREIFFLGNHRDLPMIKCLALMKASNVNVQIVKCLALYLEMKVKS